MMRWGQGVSTVLASAVVVVSAVFVGVPAVTAAGADGAVAGDNESPLADAGLDRTVSANTTVYLDATGSRDPDGEIDRYRWRIEQPDGNYRTPSCEYCGRTEFVPREPGLYNATVVVTDEDGATSTDTLRVRVEPSNGPSVSLSGPDSVVEGGVAEYTVSVSAGANDLAAVVWHVDDRRVNRTAVSGESVTADRTQAFRNEGTATLSVTAVDRLGRERSASKNVTVTDPDPVADGGARGAASGSSSGGDDDRNRCSRYDADDTYCDNDRMTLDSDGIVIADADNDGSTQWAGVRLTEGFAQNHDGVSYDSTDGVATFESQEAYREALSVDSVNVDPDADVNSQTNDVTDGQIDENSFNQGSDSGNDDSSGDQDTSGDEDSSNGDDSSSPTERGQSTGEADETSGMPDRTKEKIERIEGGPSSGTGTDQNNDVTTRTGRVPHGRASGGV